MSWFKKIENSYEKLYQKCIDDSVKKWKSDKDKAKGFQQYLNRFYELGYYLDREIDNTCGNYWFYHDKIVHKESKEVVLSITSNIQDDPTEILIEFDNWLKLTKDSELLTYETHHNNFDISYFNKRIMKLREM